MTYCFHHTLLNMTCDPTTGHNTSRNSNSLSLLWELQASVCIFLCTFRSSHTLSTTCKFYFFFLFSWSWHSSFFWQVSSNLNYKRHTHIWWVYDQSQHIIAGNWHWQSYKYCLIRTTYCKAINLKLSKMPENVTVYQITYNNYYKLLNNLFKPSLIPLVRKRGSNSCPTNICISNRIWMQWVPQTCNRQLIITNCDKKCKTCTITTPQKHTNYNHTPI
jgi:hypothetical protein